MVIKRIYFGHPVNTFGTETEEEVIENVLSFLKKLSFDGGCKWIIENPNTQIHQERCLEEKNKSGNAMTYFFDCVLPICSGGIFLPFRDGKWGKGVAGEAKFLIKNNCPVWEITHTGQIRKITTLSNLEILSVYDTRKKIRDNNGMRYY